MRDDEVRDHVRGLVRDARRNLEEAERSLVRARADFAALEARAARGRDRLALANRLRARVAEAAAGDGA